MSAPGFDDHAPHLLALRAAALQAADPAAAVRGALTGDDFSQAARVFIVGAGKAGVAMATAAVEMVGVRLAGGVMAVPHLPAVSLPQLSFVRGGHPLPDAGSLAAGQAMADLLAQTTREDVVLVLISGGGSALLEGLRPGITLADLRATNAALLRSGATIHEFNAVRKCLSRLKGGGLARLAGPARVLGLIMSDVVGNDLSVIASGPTVTDTAAAEPAADVLRRYALTAALPPAVVAACLMQPPAAPAAARVENRLIASNRLAGEAAAAAARRLGLAADYLGDAWQGEARETGAHFARQVLAGRGPRALIAGGETTVTVRGQGRGGRNQEAALAAALVLADAGATVVSTFATDGVDGPTDAAGATATGTTTARALAQGLDPQAYLADNNAYAFFAALGDLVRLGPTGTNVNDLWFGLGY